MQEQWVGTTNSQQAQRRSYKPVAAGIAATEAAAAAALILQLRMLSVAIHTAT